MSRTLGNGRATLAGRLCRPPAARGVRAKTTSAAADMVRRLGGKAGLKLARASMTDRRRVNIVSEGLCDDIIKYLGPSLERHRGCDLLDMNPGVGIWSRKLHDFLEPRKHILMDVDAERYRPFLGRLLASDKVTMLAKSGIKWKDLLATMHTELTDQRETDKGATPTRNDTLLVTANLSTHPKRAYGGFDSISAMVIYQFISSIRCSTLFQRYGLVRMLLWVNDEDKRRSLPRSLNRRRRGAFEAELSCEWIHEVAGPQQGEDRVGLRDHWINVESGLNVLQRMAAQGMAVPAGRETKEYAELAAERHLMGQRLAGTRPPMMARPFKHELEDLERRLKGGGLKDSVALSRLKFLKKREQRTGEEAMADHEFLQQYEAISRLAAESPRKFAKANADWNERIDGLKKNQHNAFLNLKDNYHLFRQDPPALLWDRRRYEPLLAHADEFFPRAPTALLDMQPKAMNPLFRQYGPGSSRSGDMSDAMLRSWYNASLQPIPRAMDALWGGFSALAAECPSLTDWSRGGAPMTGGGGLVARAVNEAQWAEIMQAWMDWPFRPSYVQMLGRLVEEVEVESEDDAFKGTGHLNF